MPSELPAPFDDAFECSGLPSFPAEAVCKAPDGSVLAQADGVLALFPDDDGSGSPLRMAFPDATGATLLPEVRFDSQARRASSNGTAFDALFRAARQAHAEGFEAKLECSAGPGLETKIPLRLDFVRDGSLVRARLADLPKPFGAILSAKTRWAAALAEKASAGDCPFDAPWDPSALPTHSRTPEPNHEPSIAAKESFEATLIGTLDGVRFMEAPARLAVGPGFDDDEPGLRVHLLEARRNRWAEPEIFFPSGEFGGEDGPSLSDDPFDAVLDAMERSPKALDRIELLVVPADDPVSAWSVEFEWRCYETAGSGLGIKPLPLDLVPRLRAFQAEKAIESAMAPATAEGAALRL